MKDTGAIAIFPLPNVVHFPETDLRLHIFEPRYRQLISDLIDRPEGERLIGMVLITGPAPNDSAPPPVHPLGTAGQLREVETLPDGRFNVVLRGRFRFAMKNEFPSHPYRQAIVEHLADATFRETLPEVEELREATLQMIVDLRQRIGRRFPLSAGEGEWVNRTTTELVNTVAAQLDLPIENKLDLLHRELDQRADRLLSILRSRLRTLDLLDPFRGATSDPDLN